MSDPHEETDVESAISVEPSIRCWRCDLEAPSDSTTCPHCAAPFANSISSIGVRTTKTSDTGSLNVLLCTYALLLATGIIHAVILDARVEAADTIDDALRHDIVIQQIVVETIDTVIVVGAFMAWYRFPRPKQKPPARQLLPLLAFLPALALCLAVNVSYHWLLREVLHVSPIEDEFVGQIGWLLLFVDCIQPAIVEEAYCRGFTMGVLQQWLGEHSTVWISAVMFGLFHVAAPLSIPYLIFLGVCLGYLRLASGGLWLPISFHFLHNLAITLW